LRCRRAGILCCGRRHQNCGRIQRTPCVSTAPAIPHFASPGQAIDSPDR
jgi:hypothetical protein